MQLDRYKIALTDRKQSPQTRMTSGQENGDPIRIQMSNIGRFAFVDEVTLKITA